MKKRRNILFILAIALIGVSSCSKEKQLENKLVRVGDWKIAILDYKYYFNNEIQQSASANNVGSIEFNKNGSFIFNMSLSGSPIVSAGTWTNSDKEILLSIGGETTVLNVLETPKKGKMVVQQIDYYPDSNEKESYTYHLEKQ